MARYKQAREVIKYGRKEKKKKGGGGGGNLSSLVEA